MPSNHSLDTRTEYWQQHVNAWSQTELSGAKFCKAQGLVYHQFVYWRQKLQAFSPEPSCAPTPSGFSQVSRQPDDSSGLTLSLPNGIEMRGIHAGNVSVVQTLLAVM